HFRWRVDRADLARAGACLLGVARRSYARAAGAHAAVHRLRVVAEASPAGTAPAGAVRLLAQHPDGRASVAGAADRSTASGTTGLLWGVRRRTAGRRADTPAPRAQPQARSDRIHDAARRLGIGHGPPGAARGPGHRYALCGAAALRAGVDRGLLRQHVGAAN